MIINRKIKRSILESKSLYIGSLALIIISCMLFTMYKQMLINLEEANASFIRNYAQEDASFIVDRKLSRIPELEAKFNVILEEGGSIDYPISEGNTLRVFAENRKVNRYAVIKGSGLTEGGILIDPGYAKANGIEIGDSLKLFDKSYPVTGFMSLPQYLYPLKSEGEMLTDPHHFGIAVIGRNEFAGLGKGSAFYSLKLAGDHGNREARIAEFKDYLKSENTVILKWTNIHENPRVTVVTAKLDGIRQVSSAMPVSILLLTCILTGIIMWRMLKKEFAIIGTLYALGYRKSEIMKHYLFYPLTIAVAGGVAGTILGMFTLKPYLNYMLTFFNMPLDSININIGYMAAGVLLPVVLLVSSGYFVVGRALKYTPVELMRGGREKSKVGFLERIIKLDKLKFSTKFKVREQLRSIPRSLFLLLGVVLATMLLLLGFTLKSSMDFLLKDTIEGAFRYQYEYHLNNFQRGEPANGESFAVAPFAYKENSKTSFSMYGVNPKTSFITFQDASGKAVTFDQVVVTKPLADKLKVEAGDTIEMMSKLDSRTYSVTVGSVADTYVGAYMYMPLNKMNEMLGYPADSYLGLWSEKPLSIPENQLLTVVTVDDAKQAFDSLMAPLQAIMGAVAFMSFIIGLIVIYVVTSLIIEENKDNISLMKVLGYRKKEVYSLILNSSSFIVLIGYIIGVPLLLVSLEAMYQSASESVNMAIPVRISYLSVLIGFIIIYLTYELSKAMNKKKINRISMTEALKSRAE